MMRKLLLAGLILGLGLAASPSHADGDVDLFADLLPGESLTDEELAVLFGAASLAFKDFTVNQSAIENAFEITGAGRRLGGGPTRIGSPGSIPRISAPRFNTATFSASSFLFGLAHPNATCSDCSSATTP